MPQKHHTTEPACRSGCLKSKKKNGTQKETCFYRNTKRAEDLDSSTFFGLLSKPYKMSAVVSKNSDFADYLRKNLELLKNKSVA